MGPSQVVRKLESAHREQVSSLRKAGLSYAEIGRRLGVTRERVRQIAMGNPAPRKPKLDSRVMLTVGDAAQLMGVNINTVRRWSNKGILETYRVGPRGDRRFRRQDVDSFLKRTEIEGYRQAN